MTDPIVPDPAQPTPPPAAPAAPAAPAYAAPAAGVPGAKKGLSLTSFILGIAAVVLIITNWFAVLVGIVGLILGLIGRSREPGAPRWMALLGIILSIVGIIGGAIWLIVVIVVAVNYGNAVNDLQQLGN